MLIDVHTHLFPPQIAEKALGMLAGRVGLKPAYFGSVDAFLPFLQKEGVEKAVVLSIATNPKQMVHVNDFAIQLLQVPQLIPFGSVHPDSDNWEAELERLCEAGIKGIKLHPDEQKFYVEEDRMVPIYKKIFSLGLALSFHAGYDIGLKHPVHCTPKGVAKRMDLFEGQPVIFAHMGGYDYWEDVKQYMAGHAIYIDTSFSVDQMPLQTAFELIQQHGADRVLFGSDAPWGKASVVKKQLESMPLTIEEKNKIFWDNANGLFLDK